PSARSILGDRAGRHVNVKFPAAERPFVYPKFGCVTLYVTQSNARGLFHDIAELTRKHESGVTGHGCGFDEEDVTADSGHRQTRRDARRRCARSGFVMDLRAA